MNLDHRAEINRANALHSTGPITPAGKQRSALNATRHGLTGQTVVMPGEDLQAYLAFTKSFHTDLQPKGALETQLVQFAADTSWRLNRAHVYEINLLTLGMLDHQHEIDADHPQVQAALELAASAATQSRALANLSLYFQRTHRQLEKALVQLRELQAQRHARERAELTQAVSLLRLHNHETRLANPPVPYNPPDDGFVFTLPQIKSELRRQDRESHAHHYAQGDGAAA